MLGVYYSATLNYIPNPCAIILNSGNKNIIAEYLIFSIYHVYIFINTSKEREKQNLDVRIIELFVISFQWTYIKFIFKKLL